MNDKLLANRYKVIDKFGEGGMGIVWKVYDTLEHREVALKQFFIKGITKEKEEFIADKTIISQEIGFRKTMRETSIVISKETTREEEEDLRFKQEFRTMVKLRHPNTVNVYDYGKLEDGSHYLTMEIVSGRDLRDILKERQLSFSEIYTIIVQTAKVLN